MLEGGPFQETWWVEESRGLVPYLNVTANWSGAPDQGLLFRKGGRAFPFCALLDETGEVLWEVRPISREALREGLEHAGWLDALRARARAAPEDEGLAASVELLDAFGREQRPAVPLERLEVLLAREGLDERVRAWSEERVVRVRYDQQVTAALRNRRPQAQARAFLELYRAGLRPPAGSPTAITFWVQSTRGAVADGDRVAARACLEEVDALIATGAFGPPMVATRDELKLAVEALGE